MPAMIIAAGCTPKSTPQASSGDNRLFLIAGSYSPADSAGVRLYSFNPETAETELLDSLKGISNPSFQTPNADGTVIYSVGEDSGPTSTVNAIAFDRESRTLKLINTAHTLGGSPCYARVSPDGNFVVTANYTGANVSIFALDSAGGVMAQPALIEFEGSGPLPDRQEQHHPHCIAFTPGSNRMIVTDLGCDIIHTFALDPKPEAGNPHSFVDMSSRTDIALESAGGPRHIVFDKPGHNAYLINELSGNVTRLECDGGDMLMVRESVKADHTGAMGSGDIHLSPDGKYLYASNRLKNDGIAIFSVNGSDGTLTPAGYRATGIHPRNFAISPDGNYLLVACRDSNAIEIYRRDQSTGMLQPTGQTIAVSKPVCLTFIN